MHLSGSGCLRIWISSNRPDRGGMHTLHKVHAAISQIPKEWLLPTLDPVAGIPSCQKMIAIGSVSHETSPCFSLHMQENAVMKDSHLAGSNTTTHVVFFQMRMHQFE